MMLQIAAPSERILIAGAPAAFVERLTKIEDLGQKGSSSRFAMPYSCPTCRSTSAREVDVAQHWDVLKFATAARAQVPRLRLADDVRGVGGAARAPAFAAAARHPRRAAKQVKHFQEESLKKALAAKATNGAGVAMPLMLPVGRGRPRRAAASRG